MGIVGYVSSVNCVFQPMDREVDISLNFTMCIEISLLVRKLS